MKREQQPLQQLGSFELKELEHAPPSGTQQLPLGPVAPVGLHCPVQHSELLVQGVGTPLHGIGVGRGIGVGVGVGGGCACSTTRMVALAEVDAGGLPLSVHVKRTGKLCPAWLGVVCCRYRPLAGTPLVCVKLEPGGGLGLAIVVAVPSGSLHVISIDAVCPAPTVRSDTPFSCGGLFPFPGGFAPPLPPPPPLCTAAYVPPAIPPTTSAPMMPGKRYDDDAVSPPAIAKAVDSMAAATPSGDSHASGTKAHFFLASLKFGSAFSTSLQASSAAWVS